MSSFKIRPHHGLCTAFFEGKGYSGDFVRNMANVLFIRPKKRPYRTKNFYIALEKQNELDKEVYAIVSGKAHTKRKKAD